jgi:glycogen synthase
LSFKVLMYGWEFPPFISGGLGIALIESNVEVNFVLPNFPDNIEDDSHVNIINSSKIRVSKTELLERKDSIKELLNLHKIDTILSPYITELEYLETLENLKSFSRYEEQTNSYQLNINANYGPNLLEEVTRYAFIAGFIAQSVEHDIIHVHDWMTILAGIEARKYSKKPLVYQVHALETDRSDKHSLNINVFNIEKYGLEQADLIIAVSHYTKACIIDNYGINPDKIQVVHNSVSKEKAKLQKNKFVSKKDGQKLVLFLGRVTYQKGPDYFLEAAAKVLQFEKDAQFVIAGHGDMANKLIDRAAQLKIGNKVHFTGFLNRVEVEALFRAADIYVMPSVSEPFGISSLEAALFDVPVILSKQSGVSEVLHNALKVDFWDTNELANQIVSLIKNPALKKQILKGATQELKESQWENSARKIIGIYEIMTHRVHNYA